MVTSEEILTAVNQKLVDNWPDRPVYRDFIPKDFERPAFFLPLPMEKRTDANIHLLHVLTDVSVIILEETDEYGTADSSRLMETQRALMELFGGGKLRVGDRALNITVTGSGIDDASATVTIKADYYRPRTNKQSEPPLMGRISTRIETEV